MWGFFYVMISWAFMCTNVVFYIPSLWVGCTDLTFYLLLDALTVFLL